MNHRSRNGRVMRCPSNRLRYPHLHLAVRAAHTAGPDVRTRLCAACGGFHLTTTGTPSGDLR